MKLCSSLFAGLLFGLNSSRILNSIAFSKKLSSWCLTLIDQPKTDAQRINNAAVVAEKTERQRRVIEIDPLYADLTIKRFEATTRRSATLIKIARPNT